MCDKFYAKYCGVWSMLPKLSATVSNSELMVLWTGKTYAQMTIVLAFIILNVITRCN